MSDHLTRVRSVVAACTLGLLLGAPVSSPAHHSFAVYDFETEIPFEGVVETLTFRNSEFIHAIRLQGASAFRIIVRHILPLCSSSVIIRVTLDMAGIILTAAGLGFLGLGAQPPLPEWGAMISRGRAFILDQWWVATMPGFAIVIVSLGFCFLGDGLRDVLDPKQGGKS
jgi:peptide/nickel transport system permease protein